MSNIINFPETTCPERISNLTNVMLNRLSTFDGSPSELQALLQEISSLQAQLTRLSEQLKQQGLASKKAA